MENEPTRDELLAFYRSTLDVIEEHDNGVFATKGRDFGRGMAFIVDQLKTALSTEGLLPEEDV